MIFSVNKTERCYRKLCSVSEDISPNKKKSWSTTHQPKLNTKKKLFILFFNLNHKNKQEIFSIKSKIHYSIKFFQLMSKSKKKSFTIFNNSIKKLNGEPLFSLRHLIGNNVPLPQVKRRQNEFERAFNPNPFHPIPVMNTYIKTQT